MDSPYLESGESIILTTDRVSVNSTQYDMLLTTRHLILVDIRYAQFEPRKFPLLTILSVKGGTVTTGDLVITLSFSDTSRTGGSEQINLIFSRQPGEHRDRERDEWLKKLMELIVSVRQEAISTRTTSIDHEIGIRPAMRRPVAPEMQPPHTTAINFRTAPIELNIIPDEPEPPAFPEEKPGSEVRHGGQRVEGTPDVTGKVTASPDTVLPVQQIPIVSQEELPLSVIPEATIPEETPAEASGAETVSPDTVSLNAPEIIVSPFQEEHGESISIPDVIKPEGTPADPGADTASLDRSNLPVPEIVERPAVQKEGAEPSETVPPEGGKIIEPVGQPPAYIIPQSPGSPPPPAVFGSRRKLFIIVTAIIILILGIGGGAVFYPNYFAPGKGLFPVPTPAIPETTAPIPSTQMTPAPAHVVIPSTGVWVRVIYPRNYYGRLGNPGSLRGITGSGDRFYQMNEDNHLVQVQIYKTDNSGDTLTVEIYRNGEIINRHETTAPMGFIELLIDARTGNPPGITPRITQSANQTITRTSNLTSQISNQTMNQTGSISRAMYF
ncbi:MAG: hypothetical protein ABSE07_08130 [Methanoregula sp.]|jgi:hypothetical protein